MPFSLVYDEGPTQPIAGSEGGRLFWFDTNTNQMKRWDGNSYMPIAPTTTGGGGGEAFPVGSVFISVVSTNPATLLGYGTWSAFGAGRVLVGLDSLDTDFDVAEEIGGAKTHTLSVAEIPAHTHVQNAHNHAVTDPAHNHTQNAHTHTLPVGATDDTSAPFDRADAGTNASGANATTSVGSTTATNVAAATGLTVNNTTAVNQNTGGGGAHNNLPPYIVVYMWRRLS